MNIVHSRLDLWQNCNLGIFSPCILLKEAKKSQTPFPEVHHRFQKVFWHPTGPLIENPTGYDEFCALWAILSHSTTHHTIQYTTVHFTIQNTHKAGYSSKPDPHSGVTLWELRWTYSDKRYTKVCQHIYIWSPDSGHVLRQFDTCLIDNWWIHDFSFLFNALQCGYFFVSAFGLYHGLNS